MIQSGKVRRKVLETYEREMKPLLEAFPVYLEKDMKLFELKMHGLKGASRQIGRREIGDFAEHMEMAAKDKDIEYIRKNLCYFLKELEAVLAEIEKEKNAIPIEKKEVQKESVSVQTLFIELKKGFDAYNLKKIEDILELLGEAELTFEQKELLDQLQQACDEMEYEKGSELLSGIE